MNRISNVEQGIMNFEGHAFRQTSSLEIPCWIFDIRVLKGI